MNGLLLASAVVALGGFGTWLLLPHRLGRLKPRRTHAVGAILCILAVVLLSGFYTGSSTFLQSAFFYVFATMAVSSSIAMVTSRNPIYSALWFASVVLASSGLFLLAGAQFLAAGTVIVYAGAIIVTFLFVIMLAQSEGQAIYDRMSRAPGTATLSAFLLLWAVFYALLDARSAVGPVSTPPDETLVLIPATALVSTTDASGRVVVGKVLPDSEPARVMARAISSTAKLGDGQAVRLGTPPPHVAGLGGTLFADHLLSVENAGAILFVALIGAIALATPKPPIRPATLSAVASGDVAQAKSLREMPV